MDPQTPPFTLTDDQHAVVDALRGPLLVLAPVGSGKTWVLARRLQAAVASGLSAERCLCLTFTNRAARELRERATDLTGVVAAVFTFHGFCAHLLRLECDAAGLPFTFSILDENDSVEMLGRCHPDRSQVKDEVESEARRLYQDWGRRLSALPAESCSMGAIAADALHGLKDVERAWLGDYLTRLKAGAALDFPLLVHQCRALLTQVGEVRARWEERYDWIQVDEVQDTHLSEWSLLEALARRHGNLAFFGDLDQTIYGWRGSRPDRLLAEFRRAFGEPRMLSLELNHRGTRAILELAGAVAEGLPDRHTRLRPAPDLPEGEPVRWLLAEDPAESARRLALDLLARGGDGRSAVLARSNGVCRRVAAELEKAGGTALLEEDLRLSRRPDVRALLAPLRLAVNGEDLAALRRWLLWGGLEIGMRRQLQGLGPHLAECQLSLTDLVQPETLRQGDPFAGLLEAWEHSHHVVLDVETSGLDPEHDEVLEIACQRWSRNVELDRLHLLLKPSQASGAGAAAVHGIDEDLLRREGRDPAQAFAELADFVGSSLVVGHNISFDLAMLGGQAERLGLRLPDWPRADTLLAARRVLRTGSMRLKDLAERLGLDLRPTHRAMDDVGATALLLERLIAPLLESREDRRDLVAGAAAVFQPWAERLDKLRALSMTLRPAELLDFAAAQDWFRRGLPGGTPPPALARLARWFRRQDQAELAQRSPRGALRALLEQATLARPVDLLEDGAVPVLTIHAAKGMEFDQVWLAGLVQGILPDFRNQEGDGLAEERRVCYVGLTRARVLLTCCAWRRDERGRAAGWSEFVAGRAPRDD